METTKTAKRPGDVLDQRMEDLRLCLIEHFGAADNVPTHLKTAYLAAAVCSAELTGISRGPTMATPPKRIRS